MQGMGRIASTSKASMLPNARGRHLRSSRNGHDGHHGLPDGSTATHTTSHAVQVSFFLVSKSQAHLASQLIWTTAAAETVRLCPVVSAFHMSVDTGPRALDDMLALDVEAIVPIPCIPLVIL